MIKWEYRNYFIYSASPDEVLRQHKVLNRLGQEGWEAYVVHSVTTTDGKEAEVYFLKRILEDS